MSAGDVNGNLGALQTQVGFLERGHSDLRKELQSLDTKMESGFTLLSQKLDIKTTTNWQPIGIMLGCLTTVGIALATALYMPVREAMSKHEAQIETLRLVAVPRVELDRQWREAVDREKLVDDRIKRLFEADLKNAVETAYLKGQLNPLPR